MSILSRYFLVAGLLGSFQPAFGMKIENKCRPGHRLDQARAMISSISSVLSILYSNLNDVFQNNNPFYYDNGDQYFTLQSQTGTHFEISVSELDALAQLAPTIGHIASDLEGTGISTISLNLVSNEALYLLTQMVRGNSGLHEYIQRLSVARIKKLKQDAQFLDSQALKDLILGKDVVNSAKRYIGHVRHCASRNSFENEDRRKIRFINDFRVLFCANSPITLLESTDRSIETCIYKPIVEKKREAAIRGDAPPENKQQALVMNCWEFCLLSLVDGGILESKDVEKLCEICNEESNYYLVHAFQYEKAILIEQDNQNELQPGDVLFFVKDKQMDRRPFHVAIHTGNYKFIENAAVGGFTPDVHEYDFCLERFERVDIYSFKIFFLPVWQIRKNVEEFIRLNAKI